MPFKKDTSATLQNTADITAHRQQPLSQEGLTSTNLGGFTLECDPNEPGISTTEHNRRLEEQTRRLNQTNASIALTQQNIQQTQAQQQRQHVETYGLVIPSVENVPKPPGELTVLDEQLAKLVIIKIWDCVVYNKLYYFFTRPTKHEKLHQCEPKTPQQRLQDVVNRASMHDYQILMELYKIPTVDQATDIAVLALFDVIELIDDSSSMKTTGYKDFCGNSSNVDFDPEEIDRNAGIDHNNKSRWNLAESIVKLTSYTLTMFDDDGISVRFLNKDHRLLPNGMCDNVTNPTKITELFSMVQPSGGTNIGSSIKKIYNELVSDDLHNETLCKPILLITYTDGESSDQIKPQIRSIREDFKRSRYGSRGMLFSFNQVGRDKNAQNMLEDLDNDEISGNPEGGAGAITDCTSSYKDEKDEYDRKQLTLPLESRVPYSCAFHMIKGLVGPAIEAYDKSDESTVRPGNVSQTTFFGNFLGR